MGDAAARESIERLSLEIEELRASRKRLVQAGVADRRRIERELHDGPVQHLVGLAVDLQRARTLVDRDQIAAIELLEEMRRTVRAALDELRVLADRIHPPLLEAGGLRLALRSAASDLGVPTRVQVATGTTCPPEVASAVYFCCIEALERFGSKGRPAITVQEEPGTVVFEIVESSSGSALDTADIDSMKERVEALDGRLTVSSEPGGGTRIAGSLPV